MEVARAIGLFKGGRGEGRGLGEREVGEEGGNEGAGIDPVVVPIAVRVDGKSIGSEDVGHQERCADNDIVGVPIGLDEASVGMRPILERTPPCPADRQRLIPFIACAVDNDRLVCHPRVVREWTRR